MLLHCLNPRMWRLHHVLPIFIFSLSLIYVTLYMKRTPTELWISPPTSKPLHEYKRTESQSRKHWSWPAESRQFELAQPTLPIFGPQFISQMTPALTLPSRSRKAMKPWCTYRISSIITILSQMFRFSSTDIQYPGISTVLSSRNGRRNIAPKPEACFA